MNGKIENMAVFSPLWLVGGVERMLSTIMPAWRRRRSVCLVTPRVGISGLPVPEGICRVESPRDAGKRVGFWEKLVKERHIDTVVLNSYEDVIPDMARLADLGVRMIRVHHGAFAATAVSRPLREWLEQARALAAADMTVCLTAFDARALAALGYTRICVIPNAVPEVGAPAAPDAAARKGTTILYVGRLATEKNIDRLIACFPKVIAAIPDARLWLTANPGSLSIREVEAMIGKAGLEGKAFLKPALDDPEPYYREADCLVLPSYREGFGLVILEAKRHALPTVMFDLDNIDSVTHGVDGLKAPLGDFDALAGHMIALLKDGELRRIMEKNALASLGGYELPVVAEQWERLFRFLETGEGEAMLERPSGSADAGKMVAALAAAQDEYQNSFYCFLHRHPAAAWLVRKMREAFPHSGPAWRVFRRVWVKALVPLFRLR